MSQALSQASPDRQGAPRLTELVALRTVQWDRCWHAGLGELLRLELSWELVELLKLGSPGRASAWGTQQPEF